ncbi:MAG: ABC transporter permease [Chloroflexi bacterium]|nr:ABC transporter permease [Chloroflexota bacterium]MBU1749890.1 ABC transporter permease [Chloroflexota bacterium]
MSLWQTVKVAWEGVTLNKVRSFLTMLGVIIGVAAVIIMLAVSAGAEADIADQINALGANLIMISPQFSQAGFRAGGMGGLPYEDIEAIAQNVSGINGVSAEQDTTQNVSGNGTALESISIVGTTPDFPAVREFTLGTGRFLILDDMDRKSKVAVLGYGIAQDLFGDANPIGQQVKIGTYSFAVVGVMAQQGVMGNTDYDARVYIPITVVFQKFNRARFGDMVRSISVSAQNRGDMQHVMDQITTLLVQRHNVDPLTPDFRMITQDTIINAQASTTETFRNLLAWVAGVSLIVGGIGIMNIMLVSVTERTREIGLRQALGARPRDVQLQFLVEALMLSLVGGLIGATAGIGGSYLFNILGTMRAELVPLSIPLAFLAAAAVGVFFGYYPATQAAQLDPIEALRRE